MSDQHVPGSGALTVFVPLRCAQDSGLRMSGDHGCSECAAVGPAGLRMGDMLTQSRGSAMHTCQRGPSASRGRGLSEPVVGLQESSAVAERLSGVGALGPRTVSWAAL